MMHAPTLQDPMPAGGKGIACFSIILLKPPENEVQYGKNYW